MDVGHHPIEQAGGGAGGGGEGGGCTARPARYCIGYCLWKRFRLSARLGLVDFGNVLLKAPIWMYDHYNYVSYRVCNFMLENVNKHQYFEAGLHLL